VQTWTGIAAFAFMAASLWSGVVHADPPGNPAAVKNQDGKYYDAQGNPTFSIQPDGTVDWYTYSGYIRYELSCLRCHGPDGLGSSYAPSLVDSLKTMSYTDFLGHRGAASGPKIAFVSKRNYETSTRIMGSYWTTTPCARFIVSAIVVVANGQQAMRSKKKWPRSGDWCR
jgi:hypothetical protein